MNSANLTMELAVFWNSNQFALIRAIRVKVSVLNLCPFVVLEHFSENALTYCDGVPS